MLQPVSSPTRVRHLVVFSTAFVAVILYLDRLCISFAGTYIKQDLDLTDQQLGWVISCFFLTYALAQVPSGWLSDRFGGRVMLTIYVLGWSLFAGLIGLAIGFISLLAMRLLCGVFQAGAYPTSASLLSKWVPFSNRGMASSVIAFGGRVGGSLAMVLTAFLIALCVPTSVPSKLDSDDLLRMPELCFKLQQTEIAPRSPAEKPLSIAKMEKRKMQIQVNRRIDRRLSVEGRRTVQGIADLYQQALDKANSSKKPKDKPIKALSNEQMAGIVHPEQSEQLAKELNGILNQADFYDAKIFLPAELPNEGKAYMQTLQDGGSLEKSELTRLNRLLLEAVYPKNIKKVYVAGWRWVMWMYGALGLFAAGLFWFFLRNRPQEHPRCNQAELAVIEHGRPPEATRPDGKVGAAPIKELVRSGSMWLCCIAQFFTNIGWVFIVTWAPRYFEDHHEVPLETRGWMVFVPVTVGWLGMLCGGRLTDWLVGRVGLRLGRALPMSLSRFMAMAAYIYCLTDPSNPWLVVAAFSVVAFSTDLGSPAVWAFNQDVGGKHVGSILGWGNMWGNFGAFVGPPLVIYFVGGKDTNDWNLAFIICAAAFFLSGIAALGVNATIPIAPPDEEEQADGDEKKDE